MRALTLPVGASALPTGHSLGATRLFSDGLEYVHFYDRDQPNYIFANYSTSSTLDIDGKIYNTPEHYFQAQKFASGTPAHDAILRCKTADEARNEAKKYKMTPAEVKAWNEGGSYAAMLKVVQARYDQDATFKTALDATKATPPPAYVYEDTYTGPPSGGLPDAIWGGGADGKGQNLLGLALMHVRDHSAWTKPAPAAAATTARGAYDWQVDAIPPQLLAMREAARAERARADALAAAGSSSTPPTKGMALQAIASHLSTPTVAAAAGAAASKPVAPAAASAPPVTATVQELLAGYDPVISARGAATPTKSMGDRQLFASNTFSSAQAALTKLWNATHKGSTVAISAAKATPSSVDLSTNFTFTVTFQKSGSLPPETATVTATRNVDLGTGLTNWSMKPVGPMGVKECYEFIAEQSLSMRYEASLPEPRSITLDIDDQQGIKQDRKISVNGKEIDVPDITEKQAIGLQAFLDCYTDGGTKPATIVFNGTKIDFDPKNGFTATAASPAAAVGSAAAPAAAAAPPAAGPGGTSAAAASPSPRHDAMTSLVSGGRRHAAADSAAGDSDVELETPRSPRGGAPGST